MVDEKAVMAEIGLDESTLRAADEFTAYVYLDGHRSSSPGKSDTRAYKMGIAFFKRFLERYVSLGFKDLVVMVHTERNKEVSGRIRSVHQAVLAEVGYFVRHVDRFSYRFYGEAYEGLAKKLVYELCRLGEYATARGRGARIHILLNYSEEWAIRNPKRIAAIPDIGAAIRFTRGYISGGVIPTRMNRAVLVYAQAASNTELWSDEAICRLILISFANWCRMSGEIGRKTYREEDEKAALVRRRVCEPHVREITLAGSGVGIPVLVFDEVGPLIYLV